MNKYPWTVEEILKIRKGGRPWTKIDDFWLMTYRDTPPEVLAEAIVEHILIKAGLSVPAEI